MLVSNFELRWDARERRHFRLRITNLEPQLLEYALDFVIASNDPPTDLTQRIAERFRIPYFVEFPEIHTPWRREGERYLKTVYFKVRPQATRSVVLETARSQRGMTTAGWFEGYAQLRLPPARDGERFLRWTPQRGAAARVLLAAESLLEQESATASLTFPRSEEVARFTTHPGSVHVEPLPLSTGQAENQLEPQGLLNPRLDAATILRSGESLRARLAAGDSIHAVAMLSEEDQLAVLVERLAELDDNAEAIAALNGLLEASRVAVRLGAPQAVRPVRRRRRPR